MEINLTPQKAFEGIGYCILNAKNKFEDAEVLFKEKKYSSAFSLYAIALQECGKIKIIAEISKLNKNQNIMLKDLWKKFRDHKIKDFMGDFFQVSGEGGPKVVMNEYQRLLRENMAFSPEDSRLDSLYVDFNSKAEAWKYPQNSLEKTSAIRSKVIETLNRIKRLELIGFYSEGYLRKYKKFYQENFSPVFDKLLNNPVAFAEEADRQYWKDLNLKFITDLITQGILKKTPYKKRPQNEAS